MYPFGSKFCDTNATNSGKSTGFDTGSNYRFPFFGTTYYSTWVSPDGFIVFNQTTSTNVPPFNIYLSPLPNENYPISNTQDPPVVAPFYSDINYRLSQQYEPSQISWRALSPATETNAQQKSLQVGMLNQITKDVRAASLNAMWFEAQWGLVVTYYNVTLYGDTCQTGQNLYDTCLRNTFQVAIVTDGIQSFSVYNYFNITWLGSNTQGCDPSTGQSSTSYPNCTVAQMGFNSGFGRGFTSLPYAGTSKEIDMDAMSGTNITGRWVYTISGDIVHHGGCTNDTSLASTGTWPLTISPLFGPMFGGNIVNVSGPCFLNSANIKCRFGSVVSTAYNWGDMMQVMCVQPMLYEVGPITLSVSTDGGANYYFSTTYTVIQQERVPGLGVSVANANDDWLNPTTMTLTWNPLNLTTEWGNVVTIQLLGYSQKSWQIVYTFAFEAENLGTYTFTYNNQMCYQQNNHQVCSKYSLGAFRVSLSNWQWDFKNPIALWSPIVPLGWFMKDQVSYNMGGYWSHDMCRNWYNNDSLSTSWHNYLPSCPCTLNQTYVDFGRWVPSTDCNLGNYNKPGGCPRNQGAIACYQSTNITSFGSSARCCFNVYGNLLYSGDSTNGSLSQRSDPWGMYPYNNSPYIPSISHWENDLLPFYYCCLWQNNAYDCFNIFMDSRPTQDCKNYNVPGHATAFGDPHFLTMDGTLYTFNAWGEFWLLSIDNAAIAGGQVNFKLQGRFQQPYNQTWGQIHATVMTAAAMQINNGTIVTVMSNLWGDQERLLVYVDSTLLNFSSPYQYWQEYPDFIVVNNDLTGAYSNFTVIFRIGIGINIAWKTGVMEMFATIPPEFERATGGLFGYWNGNANDDLVPKGGSSSQAISASSPESVYESFGITWLVQSSESIFTYAYRASLNYNYYYNPWFKPYFTAVFPPNSTVNSGQVSTVCQTDTSCTYDYMVTENESVAIDTHQITMWDAQLRAMGVYKYSCGWLPVPDSIRQEPVSYMEGSQVTITGCMSGFMMSGYQKTYSCQSTGGSQSVMWTPTVNVYCNYLNNQPSPAIQAAIAVPICVFAVIGIIVCILLLLRFHRKRHLVREKRREERRNKRHGGPEETTPAVVPPAPIPTGEVQQSAPFVGSAPITAESRYTNVVTGTLSESYLDRSGTSQMSGASNVTNDKNMMTAEYRSHSRASNQDVNRSITPTGQNGRVSYTPNPQATVVLSPANPPLAYVANGSQRGAAQYYAKTYAPPSQYGNDSEV
jgi:hypothetical protein